MSRISKNDIELWLDHGILWPKKCMDISGEITQELAQSVIKRLHLLDSTKQDTKITILLNSEGGDTAQGLAIYDAIKNCISHVEIIVNGECYSVAAWILQAADTRRMMPNSKLMVHVGEFELPMNHPGNQEAWLNDWKDDELIFNTILLERIQQVRPHYTEQDVAQLIQFDTILSPIRTVELGLADDVVGGE